MHTTTSNLTLDQFDVVVVPFPFTDKNSTKRRPALVISSLKPFNRPSGHSVMAMITSAENKPWPLEVAVNDLAAAGLPSPSIIRMKLFTLDHRLILRKAGRLSKSDIHKVALTLDKLFNR